MSLKAEKGTAATEDDRPTLMAFDTNNRREFYVFGRFWDGISPNTATVRESRAIRINKLDGKFLFNLKFNNQEEVLAYVHPTNTNLFLGCGKYSGSDLVGGVTYRGITYFKITNNGNQLFYRKLRMIDGECRGLTYDYEKAHGTLLFTSSDRNLKVVNTGSPRPGTVGSYSDTYLIVVSDSGQIIRGHQVSFNPSDLEFGADVALGINALRRVKDFYIFGGNAIGFGTRFNSEKFTDNQPNSFVMKLLFDKSTNH